MLMLMAAKVCKGHQRTRSSAFSGGVFRFKIDQGHLTTCGILQDPAGSYGPGPLGGVEDHDLVLCRSGWSDHLS